MKKKLLLMCLMISLLVIVLLLLSWIYVTSIFVVFFFFAFFRFLWLEAVRIAIIVENTIIIIRKANIIMPKININNLPFL